MMSCYRVLVGLFATLTTGGAFTVQTQPHAPQVEQRVAFVAGSTGATGLQLVSQLLEDPRYSRVIAAVRDPNMTPAKFPGLSPSADRSKLQILAGVNYDSLKPSDLGDADVVLSGLGQRRANAEVAADIKAHGDAGWEKWLKRVDRDLNVKVASLGYQAGAKVFGRVSAMGANSKAFGWGWAIYSRVQGEADDAVSAVPFSDGVVIARPGNLNRGDLSILGPYPGGSDPNGIPCALVAKRMLEAVDARLQQGALGVSILEQDELWKR